MATSKETRRSTFKYEFWLTKDEMRHILAGLTLNTENLRSDAEAADSRALLRDLKECCRLQEIDND